MIDPGRKLLFVHIARTGGTSVEAALVGKVWWQIEPTSKHISASQTRALYGEDVWHNYTSFSIVRNPWDRIASMWFTGWWWEEHTQRRGVPPSGIQEFIEHLAPHPREHYNSLHYYAILDEPLDFVLRFESLQTDFSSMLVALGHPDVLLPHLEGRARGHYRELFTDQAAALVADIYREDITRYGYAF